MEKEVVPQSEPRNRNINEVMVRRLMALLDKELGPVPGAKPKLTLIQGSKGACYE
jgi:hypothetical protein